MAPLWITVVFILLIAIVYAVMYRNELLQQNPFLDKHLLTRGTDKPYLWLFYPSSETNAREWSDFGARSSRALHIPFLNLCYESIVKHNKDYYVRVISGVSGLMELLGEDAVPSGWKGDITPLGEAEMNWIRSAVLARFGGLWLNPASVCIRGFGPLPSDKMVFFGTDLDESYAGPAGTALPGHQALWVPRAEWPAMVEWERVCFERIQEKRGGEQIRRDFNWDAIRFSKDTLIRPHAEGMRKKNGKRIQLEDLLATGIDGKLPFELSPQTVYVPFPWEELLNRRMFGWFLRMSEEQIMESDVAVKYLLYGGH